MVKKITFFFALLLFFVILSVNFLHYKALAATQSQVSNTAVATFTVQGGNGNDAYDSSGNKILKSKLMRNINFITLDASMNGRTAELPVGTTIFLHFPKGVDNITINPAGGIIAKAPGTYDLPEGYGEVLKVIGRGTAKITVSYATGTYNTTDAVNWSGYERTTGGPFTDITSDWTVPTASTSAGDTYSSSWIGIDNGSDSNTDLIQTGTESYYASGSAQYTAWWEILPGGQQNLNTGTYPVSPGDQMSAEVKQNSGTSWTITINDITQSWTWSNNETYPATAPQSTAEWIVERPTVGGTRSTLNNYGSDTFTNATLDGANPSLNYYNDGTLMFNDASTQVISSPTTPNGTTDGFTTYYCDSSTGCADGWNNVSPSGSSDQINSVSASSPSDVWEAGVETGSPGVPVTYNYNGTSWSKIYPHAYGGANPDILTGITSDSSGNAWTVGYYYSYPEDLANAYEWNGSSWTHVTTDDPSSSDNDLQAVSTDDSGDVYAVGYYNNNGVNLDPLIEEWNGTKFAQQSVSVPSGCTSVELYGVSVLSSSDVLAVGQAFGCTAGDEYVIYQYNGSSWSSIVGLPTSATSAILYSVKAVSSTEAWAVGFKSFSPQQPLIMHYTSGGGWQEDTSNSFGVTSSSHLYSVDADSSNDVWAVGTLNGNPLAVHYNGSSWTQINPSLSSPLYINGVAVNSGIGWIGGYTGSSDPFALESY